MIRKKVYSLQFTVYSLFFLLSTAYCLPPVVSCAQPVSSAELINRAKEYDGKKIVYTGEAIGDVMKRGDYAWINLSDGKNALGIWVDKYLLQSQNIGYTGGYKSIGDLLEVEGIFHRSCLEHGGDLDIHALSMRKLSGGHKIPQQSDSLKKKLALILLGVLCLVLILSRLKRR